MKNSWLSKILVLGISIVPLLWLNSPVEAQTKRNVYSCINYQGKPSTVVDTDKGRVLLIVWESDFFRGSGWTPQKRCEEVSRRFQEFSDNKTLRFLTTGKMKGQNVICVGKATGGSTYQCLDNGLLLTLESNNDNPNQVLQNLFQATRSSSNFLRRTGNRYAFEFDKFIDEAPIISQTPQVLPPEITPSPVITPAPQITPTPVPVPQNDNFDCPPLFCD
ncbi:COP23 domain-containing protein [Geminocystis sp. CENA526]